MSVRVRFAAICAVPLLLGSCASLNFVHDPQFGIVDRALIPDLLKSIRCELITFYSANRQRINFYNDTIKLSESYLKKTGAKDSTAKGQAQYLATAARDYAVENYPHFDLSDQLFGFVSLDLKVADTIGLPTGGTSIDRKHIGDPTHSKTWHFGPTLNTQNTYDLTWNFLIEQDAELYAPPNQMDAFQCYREIPGAIDLQRTKSVLHPKDFDGLARGDYRELQNFSRIRVNGTMPLAAWLQTNSDELWTSHVAKTIAAQKERLIPVQMSYSFTVQVNAGLDTKFTLLSPKWNPLAVDVIATAQQTSNLQFALNGPYALWGNTAKTGNAGMYGIYKPKKDRPEQKQMLAPGQFMKPIEPDSKQRKGYLLYPPALDIPQSLQRQP